MLKSIRQSSDYSRCASSKWLPSTIIAFFERNPKFTWILCHHSWDLGCQTLLGCVSVRQRSGKFQDDVSPWCIVLEINKISLFQKKVKMVSQDVWCCIFSCVRNMGLWIRFIDVINKTMLALFWHPYPSEDSFVIICYNFNKSLLIKYHFFYMKGHI